MISSNIFNIAKSHSDALQDSIGKVIVPAGRSRLSTLVGMSYIGDVPEGSEVNMADVLAAATEDSVDGPSSHSAEIGNYIDALIPLVASHVDFIQNKVCPDVYKFDNELRASVERMDALSPVGMFDVAQTNSPEVIDNADFMGLIDNFADNNQNIPGILADLPAQTPAQLTEIMRVSSGNANAQIGTWLAEMGDAWILDIWNRFFASMNTTPTGALNGALYDNFAGLQGLTTFDRMNTSLALFLLSRGLMDAPLDDVSMKLDAWRSVMDAISRYTGAQVKAAQHQMEMIKNQNVVILGVLNNGKRIMVYTPTYAKYLEEGGSLEDILGAALSEGSSTYTLETLKNEGTRYAEIWNNYQAIGQSTLNSRALTSLRAEARALFANSITVIAPDEEEALTAMLRSSSSLQKQAEEAIECMGLEELRNTSDVARCLIAGIRYAHTPAKQFLTDMHEAEQAGCKSPQEAALIAAANYVADAQAAELALTIA